MLIYIITFCIGLLVGVVLTGWRLSKHNSSGVILVTKEEERTLFSLRLDSTPEELESKKVVIFRIETPE